jgi:hypothetical protein
MIKKNIIFNLILNYNEKLGKIPSFLLTFNAKDDTI